MIFSKTLERFRNNYLRGRVIFAMDLILSMLASGLSIIIVRAVLSPSAFPRTTMWPYMLTAFVASAAVMTAIVPRPISLLPSFSMQNQRL